MSYKVRPLVELDFPQAAELDKKWFGDNGISAEELENNLRTKNQKSIGVFDEGVLIGFAVFEILEYGLPADYKSSSAPSGKTLFVQQFTTQSNYKISGWRSDILLLNALEEKSRKLQCIEIWEALAKDHPYKKENNPEFDAFGFYLAHHFSYSNAIEFTWQPTAAISIECYLFVKRII